MVYKVSIRGGEMKVWATYGLYENREEADDAVNYWNSYGMETTLEIYKLVF